MLKKFTNKKGFTLMEMLIVVAIIAILVAVAIPTFNSALTKAKVATDTANIRAGFAAAQVQALTENAVTGPLYLQKDGSVTSTASSSEAYVTQAKGENVNIGGQTFAWDKDEKIQYTIGADNKVKVEKVTSSSSGGSTGTP